MGDYNQLADMLGFAKKIQYPAVRNSGGIAIMWNDDNITTNDINISSQGIHVTVQVSYPPSTWFFSAIYASNCPEERKNIWNQLMTFVDTIRDSPNNA